MSTEQRHLALLAGRAAANEGAPHSANPFTAAQLSEQLAWSHGWLLQRVSAEEGCVIVVEGDPAL